MNEPIVHSTAVDSRPGAEAILDGWSRRQKLLDD